MKAQLVSARRAGGKVGVAIVAAATLLTAACAAGQQAQTANQKETLDGTTAHVGSITLGGLAIQTPSNGSYSAGSDAPLRVVIVNSGGKPDKLTSITSPSITGWGAYRSQADVAAIQSASAAAAAAATSSSASSSAPASASGSTSGASSSSAGASSSTTPAPSSSVSATPLPTPQTSITVVNGGRQSFGVPDSKQVLLLTGLQTALHPGMAVELTFTFADAGAVTVTVPVQLSTSPQTSIIPGPSATGQEG